MSTSQYADRPRKTSHLLIPALMLAAFLAVGFLLERIGVLFGVVAGYALALRKGYRSLEGMNGDIAGYALTIAELCAAAVLVLGGMV